MADTSVSATAIIDASAEVIFAILADPAKHAAIDGTGWVVESLGSQPIAASGQIFRMTMYHPNHPDGNYEIANRIEVFEPPTAICWKPGYDADDGSRPVPNGSEAHLRLVGSANADPGAHRIPAVPVGSPGQLPRPSRRTGGGSKVSIRSDAETGLPCHLCQTSTSNASLLYLPCTTSTPRLPATAG